jgi:hypothetical protein
VGVVVSQLRLEEGDAFKRLLAVGRDLLERLSGVPAAARGSPAPKAVPEIPAGVERSAGEVNADAPEGKDLCQQSTLIIEGTPTGQAAVRRAIEQSRTVSLINNVVAQDKLMQRLELESGLTFVDSDTDSCAQRDPFAWSRKSASPSGPASFPAFAACYEAHLFRAEEAPALRPDSSRSEG